MLFHIIRSHKYFFFHSNVFSFGNDEKVKFANHKILAAM